MILLRKMLRSGRKINNETKDKRSLPQYVTRMAEQRAFYQRNRRRAWPLLQRSWLTMFNVCPFIRILEPLHVHIVHMASISYWSSDCVLKCGVAHTWRQISVTLNYDRLRGHQVKLK